MTVLTLPAPSGQDAAAGPRPLPWRRMVWVTWRQHRATLVSLPAVLGAVSVFLLIAGLKIHHDYAVLTACRPVQSSACQQLNNNFNMTDWTAGNTVLIFMNLAPALLGAFAGAPVLARELETGTFRYAWTQGYGRVRWTIAKLTLLGLAVLVLTGAFSQLFTWFFQPFLAQEDPWVLSHWFVGGTRWTRYIPVSRFWPMQFVEGAWLLVLSALLVAATVWLVRRRAA